ncbi:MAG: LysM peptidoglycan-binding domain-containing protein [Bradyrhizobium sp.]|uniref:peptidoglycan DD-metalloendopeptidase family protein n=1 Tax=Bradyrhizobium sp. TaxID=376 RepID=UPI001210202A|nr:peptidoglycan DD-metalloendopeptidase family protein [Bradyrhizobium sp.]THD68535.1 MAG: LysM peptidoglycan-binding domain-containing protein [Bradyrhizobium sp.]
MSRVVELLGSRRVPHVAVLALMSIGFAGCSADMSTRLSQSSFSNPFASQPEATGSVPTPAVEQRELPQYSRPQYQSQYQSSALPPPISAPQSYPTANGGASGGGRGVASYSPPSHPQLETTGSIAPRSVAATRGQGSTTIIVGTSDTLETLAHRYNVSPAAILQANGYKGPRALSPGQQLIIPPRQTAAVPAPVLAAPASKAVVTATAAPSVHVVNHGDTLLSIAHRNHVPVAELARANNLDTSAKLRLGMKLTVPGAKTAAMVPAAQPVTVAAAQPVASVVTADPQQKARLAQATTPLEPPTADAPVKAAEATGALPTFRWPVRGKVITSYGAKTNGKANDGINLAVPEGTPVKAAEDGVVAYSGNELKGYGNLILVRHANGYVTAYAHASELLVKRGDAIKRGQIIAKSGQSGEVGSPQLHFEIRKGSTPVDPLQFLNGA